ncbi:MAG: hypothetical protein ACI901_001507, partial [Octadecabacter sp.]
PVQNFPSFMVIQTVGYIPRNLDYISKARVG